MTIKSSLSGMCLFHLQKITEDSTDLTVNENGLQRHPHPQNIVIGVVFNHLQTIPKQTFAVYIYKKARINLLEWVIHYGAWEI